MDDFARFPARALISDGRLYDPSAVVIAGGRVQVAEKRSREAVVVFDRDDVTSVERLADRTVLATLSDGATVRVGKGKGCSCGSPLKTWYTTTLRAAG